MAKQSQNLDFNNLVKIINLPASIANGQPVTHQQISNFLSVVSVISPLTGNGTPGSGLGIDFSALSTAQANALLAKLNVLAGAEPNVQVDWNQASTGADDYIKNKPAIPSVVNNLTSTSTTDALSAAQGKILNDRIDGLGDVIVVADATERDALTGLDKGDIVHVVDDAGDGKWVKYQITAAGTGTWANAAKIVYATQVSYEGSVGATNLGKTQNATTQTITSSTGSNVVLTAATTSLAGIMTAADKVQLDLVVDASTVAKGLIEIANQTEVNAGTDAGRAVTPATLKNSPFTVKTYTQNVGNGSASSFSVNHSLDTDTPTVLLKENSSGEYWACQPIIADSNNVTIALDIVPTSNQFEVIVSR